MGESKATCTVTVAYVAPKIGDYYYSDGTWSDGGLVSIEADGLNPVWADTKPAPVAGKTVIGIVCQRTKTGSPPATRRRAIRTGMSWL